MKHFGLGKVILQKSAPSTIEITTVSPLTPPLMMNGRVVESVPMLLLVRSGNYEMWFQNADVAWLSHKRQVEKHRPSGSRLFCDKTTCDECDPKLAAVKTTVSNSAKRPQI